MEKEEKSLKKVKNKEKLRTRFINTIKKKWLINGTMTIALVIILVAVFILISTGMQKLDLTPIDLTSEKTYTLSDQSKEKVAGITDKVNIYFIGYTDDDSALILAKQYNNVNENINAEAVDITQRTDLSQKYGIDSNETQGIIVECGDKSKVLTEMDLYSYDYNTSESVDLTEQKLTSSIITVTTEDVPNVYFLSGYSIFSLEQNMNYLSIYLANEIMEVGTVDILSEGKVPDDCDTLIITSPNKDFEDIVANAIIDYIDKGGNILWFNSAYGVEKNLPNVNKVLAEYGVEPFSVGYIMETDSSKMISEKPYIIRPDMQYTDITSDIYSTEGVLLLEATKINIKDEDALTELKVERQDLLTASSTSFFRRNAELTSTEKQDDEEAGEFTVGTMLTKTIEDAKKDENGTETEPALQSKLIIYGENVFISDYTIANNSSAPIISIYYNKDLALNSMAYLTEREDDIQVRKTTNNVTFTTTEQEDVIIKTVIFVVPGIIIICGLIVWQVRRRKK